MKGVEAEEDAFIESWLEEWRVKLKLTVPDEEETNPMDERTNGGTEELTDGSLDERMDERMDERTDERTDGPLDGRRDERTDEAMDGGTYEPMDGLTDEPMNGLTDGEMDGGTNGPMNGGTDERMDERMTRYLDERMKSEFLDLKNHTRQTITEMLQDFTFSLEGILQKMATQSNIAITALCEASEDTRKGILALDTRLSQMEKDLDMAEAEPLELYQVAPENYQVDLPEISLPVFQDQDQDQDPEDDLASVRDSITKGKPDKNKLVEWILARREENLQANSYSALTEILNEAEIPTMTGRANWSKGTIGNLVVRKKAEQD